MTDITKTIAEAREALAKYQDRDARHYLDEAMGGLLSALDAAQGEAVLGSVQSGSVTIPFWVIDYAQKIELFMKVNGVDAWALGGIQSRDLPPPQAPPAAAANVTPMRQPRADLARLADAISAAVYDNAKGLSVTEAIGALELAKLELLKEQEQ